jgi:hypothetical protein
VIVVGTGEQRRELKGLELSLQDLETGHELLGEVGIHLVLEQLVGRLQVPQRPLEPIVPVDLVLQTREPLGQLLSPGLIVPQSRI